LDPVHGQHVWIDDDGKVQRRSVDNVRGDYRQFYTAFRDAVLGGDSPRVRDLALRYYPEVERMHAQMSRLKKQLG
jgi:hypothetical protein